MTPDERGIRNEQRALGALGELKKLYPAFIYDVAQASPETDARGIDMLVTVTLGHMPTDRIPQLMTIPIQIKSSEKGVDEWKIVHSDLHRSGVLVFFILDSASPRKVRRLMYRALMKVMRNSRGGMLYASLYDRLYSTKGSKKLQEYIEKIKASRKEGT